MADNQLLAWLSKTIQEYLETEAPITFVLLLIVGAVFGFEVYITARRSLIKVDIFATGIFAVAPRIAWLLSPVLHRGPRHFFGTFIMLLIVGIPVERHWTSGRYTLFLVSTGYLSIAGGAVVLSSLSDQ